VTDDKSKQFSQPAADGGATKAASKTADKGQNGRRRRTSGPKKPPQELYKEYERKFALGQKLSEKDLQPPQTQQSDPPAPARRRGRPPKAAKAADAQQPKPAENGRKKRGESTTKKAVKIIPLGGLNEIGKNLTVIEYQNDILIVDCGLGFPDDDMPGIDLVIPDYTYLEKNRDKIRGVVLTHGHEDHIGGLPYFLRKFNVPVYGTRLTLGLVEGKLKEAGLLRNAQLHVVKAGDTVSLGCMSVEFINVNHSIPDACALAIFTPAGTLVHTGDFKIDYTPILGEMIDLARFGELGKQGVLALMSDSTNAERPGSTPSERRVGESLETLFKRAEGKRIIIATFSSNVHRVQQIIDTAARFGRKVVVSGRSMENVVAKASELGYLTLPRNTLVEIDQMRRIPDSQMVMVTTGSQGEPMSALSRMAAGDHRKVSVTPNDYIIISATPIPGNEKTVTKVINDLMRLGADVMYESSLGIHVSGHAARDDIKAIIGLTRPQYFIPVHGEYKHLFKAADLAVDMGIPETNTLVAEIGRVVEVSQKEIKMVSTVPSGSVMIDGLSVGDVGSVVLRDRRLLSEEGLIVVTAAISKKTGRILAGPEITSRGFVYVRESEELMEQIKQVCIKAIESTTASREWGNTKQKVRDQLSQYLFSKTKRRPLILPIIQEINS
jgi:ribonuclease J